MSHQQPPTRESIIEAWKAENAKSSRAVGAKQAAKAMNISQHWINKLFAGDSLTEMKRQNGIRLSAQEQHYTAEELLSMLDDVVIKRASLPAWNLLIKETGVSERTWKNTIGGRGGCPKEDVYRRYHEWLCANRPTSPNIGIVARALDAPVTNNSTTPRRDSDGKVPLSPKGDGRVYGAPLHFGNLVYAPTNEQGVVFLFGMVSKALGFEAVEYLGPDFPDCEAQLHVSGGHQRKRIEFEFRSREAQVHDLSKCDLIVCWENNWDECPLPVIELKNEIARLKKLREH